MENELNVRQYNYIVRDIANDEILDAKLKDHDMNIAVPSLSYEVVDRFRDWLDQEEADSNMTEGTANFIRNLFDLGFASSRLADIPFRQNNSPASARYTNNGIVEFIARSLPIPGASFHNGIWGFTKGAREYALQCTSLGLHILDVTTTDIKLIQTIYMGGGSTWRDVATHDNYAYVAAQSGSQGGPSSHTWVINLSQLSGTSAQAPNSRPITTDNIKNIGNKDWGHTINVWNGLLFLNGAGGLTYGCKIFDLLPDPMNPSYITTYMGGDCHDSYGQTIGQTDVLFSADGGYGQYRLLNITSIRTSSQIPKIGETSSYPGSYAHQNVVSDDGTKLFVFDEGNAFDIAVFEISNLSRPKPISAFQWSGEKRQGNCIVHNGAILGNYLIVAYYNAGLRVFDVSNPRLVKEVGKYETYRDPDGDGTFENGLGGFSGAWNLATLQSGKILISDTNYGTFVVKINPPTNTPSTAPSTAPTPTPTNPKCASNHQVLMVEVKTDSQNLETGFTVKVRNKKKKWGRKVVVGTKFEENKVHKFFGCVKAKKRCYRLNIHDKGSDGIQNGFVMMYLDGEFQFKLI